MLRELLSTWENWNSRTTLANTLLRGNGDDARDKTDRDIDKVPQVHPLDALRANSELVRLLSSWQWQAVYDARWRGDTWPQIADALGVTVEQARASYGVVIDRQERLLGRDVDLYRAVL